MEQKPSQQPSPLEGAQAPAVARVRELEIEALFKRQEDLIRDMVAADTTEESTKQLEKELVTVKVKLGQLLAEYEREVDPRELMARERIAAEHGFEYVSKTLPNGTRIAIAPASPTSSPEALRAAPRTSSPRYYIVLKENTRALGPFVAALDGGKGRYMYAIHERNNADGISHYYVIDTETGALNDFSVSELWPFDSERFAVKNPNGWHLRKASEQFTRNYSDTEAYDGFSNRLGFAELHKGADKYLVFAEREIVHGPFTAIYHREGQRVGKRKSEDPVDVGMPDVPGADPLYKRIWPDGTESPLCEKLGIRNKNGASAVLIHNPNRVKEEPAPMSILDDKGQVHGSFKTLSTLPHGEFAIELTDVPEQHRVQGVPGSVSYLVNTEGKIMSGPWIIESSSGVSSFTALRACTGEHTDKQFVMFKNGHLYGPFDTVDQVFSTAAVAEYAVATKVNKGNVIETYIIDEWGKHGPFDEVTTSRDRVAGHILGFKRPANGALAPLTTYVILGRKEPVGPIENVRTFGAHEGVVVANFPDSPKRYIISKQFGVLGPIPDGDFGMRKIYDGVGMLLKYEDNGGGFWFLSKENTLLGPYTRMPFFPLEEKGDEDIICHNDTERHYFDLEEGVERFAVSEAASEDKA